MFNFCLQVGPYSSQHEMLTKCGATLRTPDYFAALTEQAKVEENLVGNQQDDCKCFHVRDLQQHSCTVIRLHLVVEKLFSEALLY